MNKQLGKSFPSCPALLLSVALAAVSAACSPASPTTAPSTQTNVPIVSANNLAAVLSSAAVSDSELGKGLGIARSNSASIAAATTDQAGHTINFDPLKLVNNEWGAPADENLTCAVYVDQGRKFGWHWNRQDPKTRPGIACLQPIYPSVRIGGNPWEQPTSAYFPVKVGEIKSLDFSVAYDYPEIPTGAFNLAYDLFLSETDQASQNPAIKAEVMIWMHGTIGQPSETYKGDFSDGQNTYELYSYVMSNGRLYNAFVMKGNPEFRTQHTVNVKRLLDNLDLDSKWYIPGIELGNEIVNGSGKIEISKFSVNMNGSVIERSF
jgi:hypothetical protein